MRRPALRSIDASGRRDTAHEVQLVGHRRSSRLPRPASLAAAVFLVAACSSSLPSPERGRHAREAFLPVPYPPPAGLAETIPPPPEQGDAVWIDGEWVFHGRTYVWQRGGWVNPPPGARYAPWRAVYQNGGRLFLAPGTWYDDSGNEIPPPEVAVPAKTPPNEVTSESQSGR